MLTREQIERALRDLGLASEHVLAHTSYKSLGGVAGGPFTVVRAFVNSFATLMMPAFTAGRTSVWDARAAFEGNAYSAQPPAAPDKAVPFTYDTPVNKTMGIINETFRRSLPVRRTLHPTGSFVAYGELADKLVGEGTAYDGLEPIRRLMEASGHVLLLGVTHTNSTAVHLAEQLAGRQLFVRYALTPEGVRAGSGGGCGAGFDALQPYVAHLERKTGLGSATLRAYALQPYIRAARELIERDPYALLCDDSACARCEAHRSRVPVG
jgi:aminoglycoside 3-N-acetyltransferase